MSSCCFIGHRNAVLSNEQKIKLRQILEKLIKDNHVTQFLFGSKSAFDDICYSIVAQLQVSFPNIELIAFACRNEWTCLKCEMLKTEKMLKTFFGEEATIKVFDKEEEFIGKFESGRNLYIIRNKAMIDRSDFCIFYYNENYKPNNRKRAKNDVASYQPNSGTRIAYNYAHAKKKSIINLLF